MTNLRCFISAKYGIDLRALQIALEQNGVDWQWAQDLPIGSSIMQSTSDAISTADFVVGVFSDDGISPNVALEVGYAVGRDVPVMLLAHETLEMPFGPALFRYLRTDLRDTKLLTFQVDLFLRSLHTTKRSKRKVFFSNSHNLQPALGRADARLFETGLEKRIASSILAAGGRVTMPDIKSGSRSADLLMWLPEADKDLFNPAAIEVKNTISRNDLLRVQEQLRQFVSISGLGCGLIIAKSLNYASELSAIALPYVFFIAISEFEEKIKKGDLGSWIRQERNRLAHGLR